MKDSTASAVDQQSLVRLLPSEDGTYFLRFSPDEHWLMTGVKGGKVYGRWIANGGGNRTSEQYPTAEWSRRYDEGEPEVYDATTDSMGAARNFASAILPNTATMAGDEIALPSVHGSAPRTSE